LLKQTKRGILRSDRTVGIEPTRGRIVQINKSILYTNSITVTVKGEVSGDEKLGLK
jgi:hypothetical protein